MPKLIIDHREIEVPKGTKVIEAAERLGIMIPRFCYHEALGSVGACRLCAVKFLEGPFKGVQMSCMIEAKDGMVVSTTDKEAVDFRKYIIELLMLHHPHDCPVCDEGGHCLLQDMTMSSGHAHRRYRGKKRTYIDQNLGPFVHHEMNRCIQCYRCSRFYQDFAGYRDYGAMQLGDRVYFGRHSDGQLESPFSGNITDVCPTGVLTDKPSRYSIRRWHIERGPSICTSCSLGCNTVGNVYLREVMRVEANHNEAVNGFFICDRGRFSYYYANHPDRPRQARINRQEVSPALAVRAATERLTKISESSGAESIACLGSPRSSIETMGALQRLCDITGWRKPHYFMEPVIERKVRSAVSRIDQSVAVSMREIEEADFILAVGTDPVNEAPMLTLAVRQAFRNGATVVVIDPRPVFLPLGFDHFPASPYDLDRYMSILMRQAVDNDALRKAADSLSADGAAALRFYEKISAGYDDIAPCEKERLPAAAEKLRKAERPVVVCGTDIVQETTPLLAADHTLTLRALKERAGLFYVLPGANAFGAALASSPDRGGLLRTIEDIENGKVKALIAVESDPFFHFPDRKRLEEALNKLDLLVALDYLPSETIKRAHVAIPTSTVFEVGGCYVNQEGRAQRAAPIYRGGIPNRQETGGDHPPRIFRDYIPGGDPKAAWKLLAELGSAFSGSSASPDDYRASLARLNPIFEQIGSGDYAANTEWVSAFYSQFLTDVSTYAGCLVPEKSAPTLFAQEGIAENGAERKQGDGFELLLTDWTFGTEELSNYSRYIHEAEKEPCLYMHAEDAKSLNLASGDAVAIRHNQGVLRVKVSVADNMARGFLILPRHRKLPWQNLGPAPIVIAANAIEKE